MSDVPSSDLERLKNAVARLRCTVDEVEKLITEIESVGQADCVFSDAEEAKADVSATEACTSEEEGFDHGSPADPLELAEPRPEEVTNVEAEEGEASGLEVAQEQEVPQALSQDEIGDVLEQMAAMAAEVDVNDMDAVPETVSGETLDISDMIAQQTPAAPVVPPSSGGTILNEDELMAMLAEAESRAEEYSDEGEVAQLELEPSEAGSTAPIQIEHDPAAVALVPPVLALAALAAPIRRNGERLQMIAAEPIDEVAIQNIEAQTGMGVDVEPRPMPEVLTLLRALYKDGPVPV